MKKIINAIQPALYGQFLSLAVIAIGFTAGIVSGDWTWFSRSGSVVVAIGVLVAAHDINEALREIELEDVDELVRQVAAEVIPDITINADDIEKVKKKAIRIIRNDFVSKYKKVEVTLIILGTLIWGFGDIFDRYY